MKTVCAVLFDADGVLQSPTVRWRAALAEHAEFSSNSILSSFVAELISLEANYLETERDFSSALTQLLAKLGTQIDAANVLAILNAIDCDPEIVDVVRHLKQRRVRCYLASNQQQHRALYMSKTLGYVALFDAEFYSCHLGVAKPKAGFFSRVIQQIKAPRESLLFIDDREENVIAARQAGLRAEVFERSQGVAALRALLARHGLDLASVPASGD